MDIKEYIASGVLELYVAGALSDKENQEIYDAMQEYPEVREEVEKIEAAIVKLTAATSPGSTQDTFNKILKKIAVLPTVKTLPRAQPKTYWSSYVGWAASFILAAGLFYLFQQNNALKLELEDSQVEKSALEQKIEDANNNIEAVNSKLDASEQLVGILRDQNISTTNLNGQAVSPNSYARAYWNKEERMVYIDAQGLPEPPPGKVYQVWSLKLNPLTPTSLGTLDDFTTDDNKIFALVNTNESEAFGITLEPQGGSESPTLEMLFTLGAV